MDALEMTPEQLMELAREKEGEAQASPGAQPQERMRTIEADGVSVEVDTAKLQSWTAFRILRDLDGAQETMGQVDAALRFFEHVTGLDEDGLAGLFGGGEAKTSDVLEFVMRVIRECYPKN